jgi:uncharacterized secreted protein with C-terminal beta-propeller domain
MKINTMILVISVLLISACTTIPQVGPNDPIGNQDPSTDPNLQKFESKSDLIAYLQSDDLYGSSNSVFGMARGVEMLAMDSAPMAKTMAESDAGIAGGFDQADDYSQTNIQVKGVDEADFVKNDGKYIYLLSQYKLVIMDAFPAEDANIVSETEIDGNPSQIFINGDRLVVFSSVGEEKLMISEYDFIPRSRYTQRTHAFVFDISDRENPELVNDFNIDGNFFQARMIGDYVYFITKENVYYYQNFVDIPMVKLGNNMLYETDVYYFDNPEDNYVFHTIAAFDINDDEIEAKSYLMGYSNNIYVSQENIYIAYQNNYYFRNYEDQNKERFEQAILPMLPKEYQDRIKAVPEGDDQWTKIIMIFEEMYNEMDDDDKEKLIDDIEESIYDYEAEKQLERQKTIIRKFSIDGMDVEHVAKGEVMGYLNNQFSMDESVGNLRAATTINVWTRKDNIQHNNVFVLNEDMKTIGKLEGIAEDESIYSTRFIGDRLYMVTFKRIDPFFVIDLSDPTDPNVLGELKIPGYSDYLHPYDESHIIGIGKETGSNSWGGVSTKGVKIALFDVSDVENPKELDTFEIGDSGTDSEALHEHKAFLFDKEKNILVLPIREVNGERVFDSRFGYKQDIWHGAYVLSMTPEDGIDVKGKVSHFDGEEDYGYYWGSPYAVRRSLYMDDVLYTISSKKIVMNDLTDLEEEINSIDLPYRDNYNGGYPVPLGRGMVMEETMIVK